MNKPSPRPTIIGVAPPRAGSAPEPTRSLTPTGRYRMKAVSVETVGPDTSCGWAWCRELGVGRVDGRPFCADHVERATGKRTCL
jgi:hypothetical protein